jgi:hypothetical protein
VQHILTLCVFCRELWFWVLAPLGFLICVHGNYDPIFVNWWRRANKRDSTKKGKCSNSVIILGIWLSWKHHNSCVFDGTSPHLNKLEQKFSEEHHLSCLASANNLKALGLGDLRG